MSDADRYANYFRDLDSRTEYFDVYGRPPEENLFRFINLWWQPVPPAPRSAKQRWHAYAVIPDNKPNEKQAARQALVEQLTRPEVAEGVRQTDAVLLRLLKLYFGGGAFDAEDFFRASDLFGCDKLPHDQDRLDRVLANDPTDGRADYALFHRMDSEPMWFNWAGFNECAIIVLGENDPDHPLRMAYMGGNCIGSAMDFVTRQRGKTRPEYQQPDGRDLVYARTRGLMADTAGLIRETHALLQILEAPGPAPAEAGQAHAETADGDDYDRDRYRRPVRSPARTGGAS